MAFTSKSHPNIDALTPQNSTEVINCVTYSKESYSQNDFSKIKV